MRPLMSTGVIVLVAACGSSGFTEFARQVQAPVPCQTVEECRVLEVCNPRQAAAVLSSDMRLNMALPCRLSVYTESGVTKIYVDASAGGSMASSKNPRVYLKMDGTKAELSDVDAAKSYGQFLGTFASKVNGALAK